MATLFCVYYMQAPVVDMTFNNRVEHDEILHKVYMGPPTRTKVSMVMY